MEVDFDGAKVDLSGPAVFFKPSAIVRFASGETNGSGGEENGRIVFINGSGKSGELPQEKEAK